MSMEECISNYHHCHCFLSFFFCWLLCILLIPSVAALIAAGWCFLFSPTLPLMLHIITNFQFCWSIFFCPLADDCFLLLVVHSPYHYHQLCFLLLPQLPPFPFASAASAPRADDCYLQPPPTLLLFVLSLLLIVVFYSDKSCCLLQLQHSLPLLIVGHILLLALITIVLTATAIITGSISSVAFSLLIIWMTVSVVQLLFTQTIPCYHGHPSQALYKIPSPNSKESLKRENKGKLKKDIWDSHFVGAANQHDCWWRRTNAMSAYDPFELAESD